MNLRRVSIGATAILTVAMVSLLLRRSLFAHGIALVAAQVAAVGLMAWARLVFGGRSFHAGADPTVGGLVMTGPYRIIRHPIYTAILLFLWAGDRTGCAGSERKLLGWGDVVRSIEGGESRSTALQRALSAACEDSEG